MYKIAVCEDNSIHMNQILNVLKRYEQKHSVEMQIATFQSAELLLQTRFDSYDLVLLDINLAKLNGIENSEFFVGDVEKTLPEFIKQRNVKPDVVFVDPPRKGCDKTAYSPCLFSFLPERRNP